MPRGRAPEAELKIIANGGKAYKWEDGRKSIVLVFQNGKVVSTSTRNLGNDPPPNPDKKPLGDPKVRPLNPKERRKLFELASATPS